MQEHTTRKPRKTIPPTERFWAMVNKRGPNECWEWIGALRNGYGVMNVNKKVVYAHRFSYELEHGPFPEGMQALHSCDNRKCCNPHHIRAGTKSENVRDMYSKGRGKSGGKKGKRSMQLTEDTVRQIRQLAANGMRYPALSKQFGVSIPAICMVVTRKRWSHIA